MEPSRRCPEMAHIISTCAVCPFLMSGDDQNRSRSNAKDSAHALPVVQQCMAAKHVPAAALTPMFTPSQPDVYRYRL